MKDVMVQQSLRVTPFRAELMQGKKYRRVNFDEDLARKSIGVGNVDEPILVSFPALIHLGL